MAEPAVKVWWCAKLKRAWGEEEIGARLPCEEQDGTWVHGTDSFSQQVAVKDYGCGWHTLSKNRVTAPKAPEAPEVIASE